MRLFPPLCGILAPFAQEFQVFSRHIAGFSSLGNDVLVVGECQQLYACFAESLLGNGETVGVTGHHAQHLYASLTQGVHSLATAADGSRQPLARDHFVVDVGTGTGAIILSLAKEFGRGILLGTDVSEDAIALAKENAERCGLAEKVKFAVMDGLDDFDEPQCVDVLVSNPPYVETAVWERLDARVRDFEPRLALDGGEKGLDFYDRYLGDAVNLLRPGGAVFFEIGEGQGQAVRQLMFDYGFDGIRIESDFAGHDRYASATLR